MMSDVVAACSGDIDRPPPQGECSSQCASDAPAAVAFVVVVAAAGVVTAVATFVVMVVGGGW